MKLEAFSQSQTNSNDNFHLLLLSSRAKEKRLRRDASRQSTWQSEVDSKHPPDAGDLDDVEGDEDADVDDDTVIDGGKGKSFSHHHHNPPSTSGFDSTFMTGNSSSIDSGAESEGELSNASIPRCKQNNVYF